MANIRTECPTCHTKPRGRFFGGYMRLHECKARHHIFCDACRNGDLCPVCNTDHVW